MIAHFTMYRGECRGDLIPKTYVIGVSDVADHRLLEYELRKMMVLPPDQRQILPHLEAEGESVCQHQPEALAEEVGVMQQDGFQHGLHLILQLLVVHYPPHLRVKYWGHISITPWGVGVPNLDREQEAEPNRLVEGDVQDWTHPIHHVLKEVHEVCERVGLRPQLQILDEPIERHLAEKLYEVYGVFFACSGCCAGGAGAGRSDLVWRIAVVRWVSRVEVCQDRWAQCLIWPVKWWLHGYRKLKCEWREMVTGKASRLGSQHLSLEWLVERPHSSPLGKALGIVFSPEKYVDLPCGFSRRG